MSERHKALKGNSPGGVLIPRKKWGQTEHAAAINRAFESDSDDLTEAEFAELVRGACAMTPRDPASAGLKSGIRQKEMPGPEDGAPTKVRQAGGVGYMKQRKESRGGNGSVASDPATVSLDGAVKGNEACEGGISEITVTTLWDQARTSTAPNTSDRRSSADFDDQPLASLGPETPQVIKKPGKLTDPLGIDLFKLGLSVDPGDTAREPDAPSKRRKKKPGEEKPLPKYLAGLKDRQDPSSTSGTFEPYSAPVPECATWAETASSPDQTSPEDNSRTRRASPEVWASGTSNNDLAVISELGLTVPPRTRRVGIVRRSRSGFYLVVGLGTIAALSLLGTGLSVWQSKNDRPSQPQVTSDEEGNDN